MITKDDIKDIYALSPMQEGMLFHYMLGEDSSQYIEQMNFHIKGQLDLRILEESFNKVIEKYDVFRTIFMFGHGKKNLQGVLKKRKATIQYHDISELIEDEAKRFVEDFQINNREKGFDLKRDLLTRLSVIKLQGETYKIIWEFHHIIIDGWCLPIVLKDFFSFYKGLMKGETPSSTSSRAYSEYIRWLKKQDIEEGIKFWKDYLANYENSVYVPSGDYTSSDCYKQGIHEIILNNQLNKNMNKLAQKRGITVNSIFQALWGLLLGNYNQTNDVVFGCVVSGRPPEILGVETMVGLFINTIPVRVDLEEKVAFIDLVKGIQNQFLPSVKYSYLPLAEIQNLSRVGRELINHIVVFENYPVDEGLATLGHELGLEIAQDKATLIEQTNYGFEVVIVEGVSLKIKFRYNKNSYDEKMISRIAKQLEFVLEQVIDNPEINISNIDFLNLEHREELLNTFNNTLAEYPSGKMLHQLFEEAVEKNPHQIATLFSGKGLTYFELNEKSNQLARRLREKGVNKDTIVAVAVERSLEMIIGLLAILKAGGAYLPLDPHYPEERFKFILTDCNVNILFTQYKFNEKVPHLTHTIYLDEEGIYQGDSSNLEVVGDSTNLAYVIYTSGSTGKPKGAMLEHRAIVNRLHWMQRKYSLDQQDIILQKTPYTFDVSVWELFWGLLVGAKMCFLEPTMEKHPDSIVDAISQNAITTIHFVPSMFAVLLDYLKDNLDAVNSVKSLKRIFTSGEELRINQMEDFNRLFKGVSSTELINLYGPTEAAVDVTYFNCIQDEKIQKIPIGKPIDNIKLFILNSDMELVPVGVVGELYISGVGLARGYVNRKALTEEKFIPCPFDPKIKMYRTGDLARWLSDGNIEFIGRIDTQVKIRGFRIETGEIESVLLQHQSIKEALVIPKKTNTGEAFLSAYLVLEQDLTLHEIRNYLLKNLPNYMVPDQFVKLEELPMSDNGKLDRKQLLNLTSNFDIGSHYIPPRNDVEKKLAEIFTAILELDKDIGINDNFFQLGGHSIKASHLIARINKEFSVNLPLSGVFEHPDILQMAHLVTEKRGDTYSSILPKERKGNYPLSAAQRRLYIIDQMEESNISYNMTSASIIEGSLNIVNLTKAFDTLIERHEILRTTFEIHRGQLMQKVHEQLKISIELIDGIVTAEDEIDQVIKGFIRPFDLGVAPLFRVGLLPLSTEKNLLIFDLHHIITDGVSMKIMIKELISIYSGVKLTPTILQYGDFAYWHNEFINSEKIKKEEAYWLQLFEGDIPILNMPTDFPRPQKRTYNGDIIFFSLKEETTSRLEAFTLETGTTLSMTLMAIFSIMLSKYSGQEDIIVGLPIAGRVHPDTIDLLGMFVNTLAIRSKPKGEKTFKEFLYEVKENSLNAYENQNYQFEMLVDRLGISASGNRNPLFDTMFIMQNIENETINMRDLTFRPYKIKENAAKFDLKMEAFKEGATLGFSLDYNVDLFHRTTMEELSIYFVTIIEEILTEPDKSIRDIEKPTKGQAETLVMDFNDDLEDL